MSGTRIVGAWCAAVAVVGVVVLAIALLLGGGAPPAPPPGLVSDGRTAAWLGDLVSLLAMLISVVAVGFGTVAVGAPSGPGDLKVRARRAASSAGAAWAAVTVLEIGLLAVETNGRADLLDLDESRALIAQLVAATVCALCWAIADRTALAVAGLTVALSGLLPVVLIGHPRTAEHPVLAGITISVHVLAAALWVGGLAALGWFAVAFTHEADDWSHALQRYSKLAFVCALAVAVSGPLTAIGPLHTPTDLFTSRYGAILTLKIVLLAGLIAIGWLQRRRVVGKPRNVRVFVALAAFELTTMTVALALAAALSNTPPPT